MSLYVILLTSLVTLAGSAGIYTFEKGTNPDNGNDKSSNTSTFFGSLPVGSVTIVIGSPNGPSDKLKYHHSMEVISHEHYITLRLWGMIVWHLL